MNMMVSGVVDKNGEKVAFIRFEEEKRMAEGIIPACRITKNEGFTAEEVSQLEMYMKGNLAMLKKQAAGVNPIKSMMQDK